MRFRPSTSSSTLARALVLGAALLATACGGTTTAAPTRVPVAADLLPLLHAENPNLAHTTMLLAQTADAQTLVLAGHRLTAIAVWVSAAPTLDEDRRMRLLSQAYAAMVALPTPAVVQHCRTVANHPATAPWHRIMASTVILAESEGAPEGAPVAAPTSPEPIVTEPTGAVVLARPDEIPPTATGVAAPAASAP